MPPTQLSQNGNHHGHSHAVNRISKPQAAANAWDAYFENDPYLALDAPGPQLRLRMATLLIGCGTTSGHLIERVRTRLVEQLGGMPHGSLGFLAIDGDEEPEGIDLEYFFAMQAGSKGGNGLGTNPAAGGIEIVQANRHAILESISTQLQQLVEGTDSPRPSLPPSRMLRIVLVYGPGGVGGSLSTSIESLAAEAAATLGVPGVVIEHLLIGSEICIRARDRNPDAGLWPFIRSNHAQELQAQLERFADVPDPSQLAEGDAASSLTVIDQTNLNGVSINQMSDFVKMMADALFIKILTGANPEKRRIDSVGAGKVHGPIDNR